MSDPFSREQLLRSIFGNIRPSANQLRNNAEYRLQHGQLRNQVTQQDTILSWTRKWLLEGVKISEHWIEHVPDNEVANYIQFRQGVSNNPPIAAAPNNGAANPRLQGARPHHDDAANPRLQGARPNHDDAANLVIEGINRMRIMEVEEM